MKKYRCKACGFIYEGDSLPDDYKCPACEHPAKDFEELTPEIEQKNKQYNGTKTEQNLMSAFSGEAQACTKYYLYAAKARKDGFEQIAALFEETAKNEMAHAKLWFNALHGGSLPFTGENLREAAAGEYFEWADMYKKFAEDARSEGFADLAFLFESVAKIEESHEERYKKLLANVNGKFVFSRDGEAVWQCMVCGHIVIGKSAPETCPVCKHPQSFFKIKAENY